MGDGLKIYYRYIMTGICAFVLTAGVAAAPLEKAIKLRWAHQYEVDTPFHQVAVDVSRKFFEATNGRYDIKIYPAASLGKEAAINEGLSLGAVDIIYTGLAYAALAYEPLTITDYPFTLRDYDHWRQYTQSDLFAELSREYSDITETEIVGFTYYGTRHVTSNRPILKPADMQGLKIRVPNAPAYLMFPQATGANPTPMAFSEVYLGLQQGVVDAQENPLPTIKFKRFYEVQSHINLTGHTINSMTTLAARSTFEKMNKEDEMILRALLKEAATIASDTIYQQEKELEAWFTSIGITVNTVDRRPFMEAVKPRLTGADVPWPADVYHRLMAIGEK